MNARYAATGLFRKAGLFAVALALLLPATASAADSIYWGNEGSAVRVGNLDGTGTASDVAAGSPCGVAIDSAAGKIYWANWFSGTIQRGNLDLTGTPETLFSAPSSNLCGVAVDPANNKIYWANFSTNEILAGNADGTGTPSTLFTDPGGSAPSGVAIDPAAGKIYWTNQFTDVVRVGNLDGSGTASTLFGSEDNPIGVAIDPDAGKIYWTDLASGTVRAGNLDGSGTASTLFGGENGPGGVAIDPAAGKIYWDNFFGGTIRVGNLDGSGTASTVFGGESSTLFAALLRAPAGTDPPAISEAGGELSCSEGSWAPDLLGAFLYRAPQGFAYQWLQDGNEIAGATDSTFTPTEPGSYTCQVTASNHAGSASQTSEAFIVAPEETGATVTVAGGAITFDAGAGQTNTAVIVKQQTTTEATTYFVGDQNPNVTVTASAAEGCLPTPAAGGLPAGYLCTVPLATPITALVETLGDGNDTGVISAGANGPAGTIDGGTGDDTLVGAQENDTFTGGAGAADSVAYVGIAAAGITRTSTVVARLAAGASPSTGNGEAGENDSIAADVEGLTGGNGNDILFGNPGSNTIAGSAPPGTPDVDPQPAGTESQDFIAGGPGDDTMIAGDTGTVNGGDGNDTVVGGRSFANVTAVNGGNGDDTLVSGVGSDNLTGGAGSNALAYDSVNQGGIDVVSRSAGVIAQLPEPGTTKSGGTINGQEHDVIHDDLRTLIGSNFDDFLLGSNGIDTIGGAAPVGTGNGVTDTPAGNDAIYGFGAADTLVAGDRGQVNGGPGDDSIVGGRSAAASDLTVIHGALGDDMIVSGLGNDEIFGDAGSNTLAYASVQQQGLDIVDRGTNGVTATLPNAGQTATGGKAGGPEHDIIHSDITVLVGGNGNDILTGNNVANQIVGVAPPGTAGVKPGPAGNDALIGNDGNDLLLGAEGIDLEVGGGGNDMLLGFAGGDFIVGQAGADNYSTGEGDDRNFSRDGVAEAITCGPGADSLTADAIDTEPAGDCETISTAKAAAKRAQRSLRRTLRLEAGRGDRLDEKTQH
jgi:DNA-binding beta-propeller fold protein YncE/Ca2+-binding RTX toxin-like protein